jgi:WD40 repeat protein
VKRLTVPGVQFTHVTYLDDRTLLTADYRRRGTTVRLWDLAGDAPPRVVPWLQAGAVWQLFKPHARQFLRRQGFWPDDQELPLAFSDDPDWLPPALLPDPQWYPICFHPDGIAAAFSETVVLRGRYLSRFHLRDPAGRLAELLFTPGTFGASGDFSPNGSLVALSNGLKVVWVWDLAGPREVCQLEQGDGVSALAFVGNDRLAVAAGRTVRVWDVPAGREVLKFPAFRKYLGALAVSADRCLLAAGSRDGSVRVHDAATGRERGRYDWGIGEVSALAFAPNGQTAAAAGSTGIAVWDLE